MDIADLLDAAHVYLGLRAKNREDLFAQMAQSMAEDGAIPDAAQAVQMLMERERLMTTGIGGGVGVPHAFLPGLDHSLIAVGVCPEGVDFEALDGKLVGAVFLLLGPSEAQGRHLRILARLSRILASPGFVESLGALGQGHEVVEYIREAESRLRLDRPRAV